MSDLREALLAFRTAWSIPDHHARMEALYNASKAAEAALSEAPAQEMTDEALSIAVVDLANVAYQHGRESLPPWPEQWQKLERRILAIAFGRAIEALVRGKT